MPVKLLAVHNCRRLSLSLVKDALQQSLGVRMQSCRGGGLRVSEVGVNGGNGHVPPVSACPCVPHPSNKTAMKQELANDLSAHIGGGEEGVCVWGQGGKGKGVSRPQ